MFQFLVFLVVTAGSGTFVCRILNNVVPNVWVGRGLGCLAAAVAGGLCYFFWFKTERR